MFGVVLLVTFIMHVMYPLFVAVVVVSYFYVYLSCWVPTYAYSSINIYRGWTDNGNTRQYRNKTVCVGLHWKKISRIFRYSLFCLCCVVPVLMHYRLCFGSVCMKVLQSGRLTRFSKRTDCCCMFNWSICNQNSRFIRCIKSSSLQGYDGMHKLWEDIISQDE